MKSPENNESLKFVSLGNVVRKLGQTQYVSRFLNPDPKVRGDGTPFFENIRVEGDPDNYHNLKIHQDDIKLFIEQWFAYQKDTSPFFQNKKLEDFL